MTELVGRSIREVRRMTRAELNVLIDDLEGRTPADPTAECRR